MIVRETLDYQQTLLVTHRRTLAHYLRQLKYLGVLAPPGVVHGIHDAREAIQQIKTTLRAGHVAVDDLPEDDPHAVAALTRDQIDPWPVFERVNLERFEGREWLLAEVDTFLRGHDRGYFVLEADAGLGKTTFLAWLVRRRGYIHHFVELAPGPQGVGRGLKNLVSQLTLAFDLNGDEAGAPLPDEIDKPEYLLKLLKGLSNMCTTRTPATPPTTRPSS